MNVKISLTKKKKKGFKPRWFSQARVTAKKKSGWQEQENIGDSTKPSLWAPCRYARMQHDAQKVYHSILTLSLTSKHNRTELPYVFSSKLLLIILQMALNQALDCIWILPAAKSQPGSQNIPIWALLPASSVSFEAKSCEVLLASCGTLSEMLGPATLMEQPWCFTVFWELSAKPYLCSSWERRLLAVFYRESHSANTQHISALPFPLHQGFFHLSNLGRRS